ncbi:glycosyl transferase, group 1 [Pyrobaculum islandicum DSM 4184]|uniref:Glycosyl transferase, group 1 n=1 Tax=Pyrobaculum islandicum (strain DSM 4184 / JCM 9189 / GEO3) TaxID=384616 RepID=A1RUL9_PYRIL|nr:glycosyltransferase family 4 protein [Pyrobaculum islandicum]ABL88651.1 glycosyl transferase, group 1 [Pyrobaculum islandicum DSM 4184]
MRILWINHRDPRHPQAGGAETYIHEISKRLVKMSHEVTLISEEIDGLPKKEELDGIKILRMGDKATIHIKAPLYVKKYGSKYDLIIDSVAHAVPWYSPLVTKTPVIALVYHIHQDVVDMELTKPLAYVVKQLEKTLKLYKHFITISQSTREELKRIVKHDKIHIVPPGVDLEKYRPGPKSPIPTVLWVGRIKRYKNLEHLLLAFREVKREVRDARLVIIGTGDHEPEVKRFARSLGTDGVEFLGRATEEEKIKWMQSAWLIASTSTKEGWGLTITEAAACGTPAVAYDVPGLRDSVIHGETGLLVRPGDVKALAQAITLLLIDSQVREKLGKNAYRVAQRYSWDASAKTMAQLLREWSSYR